LADIRTINVFIASPGDLAVERRTFKKLVGELNAGFGEGADVRFVPLGWEDTYAVTGRRPQSVINEEIDRCEVFILALYRRWGQKAPDARPYSSYVEEEFHRALNRSTRKPRSTKTQVPAVLVFFKKLSSNQIGRPGVELKKILAFRKSLDESRKVFHRSFADAVAFKAIVSRHLKAYAKGELPKPDPRREVILLPLEYIKQVKQARIKERKALEQAERHQQRAAAADARANVLALELSEAAGKAALQGHAEDAAQLFAKAHQGTTNLKVLRLAYEFYRARGDYPAAMDLAERMLAVTGRNAATSDAAAALESAGQILMRLGKLKPALVQFDRSLRICKAIGTREIEAACYTGIAGIRRLQGDLERAEDMQRQSLAIQKKLPNERALAIGFSHLGVILHARGDLGQAEKMFKTSIDIGTRIGDQELISSGRGNLGLVFHARGELDRAVDEYMASLKISEKLGFLSRTANQYGNLGKLYQERSQLDKAESMIKQSLELHERTGSLHSIATAYAVLGELRRQQGDLPGARNLLKTATEIAQDIGAHALVQDIQESVEADMPAKPGRPA
jgi:tetratricopeptide (TPR) repeat protein